MEKIHYIYFDNGVFRSIAKKEKKDTPKSEIGKVYDTLYDSLIKHEPDLKNGLYEPIFTESSFLEFIGDGELLEEASPLKLGLLDDIINQSNISSLDKKLYEASKRAFNLFFNLKKLSKKRLLEKINTQFGCSASPATKKLIEKTLGKYRDWVKKSDQLVRNNLASCLEWDAICNFLYLECQNCEKPSFIKDNIKKIIEWLLRVFHDKRNKGIDLNSHRLFTFAREYTYRSKGHKNFSKAIKRNKDLCDADVIHYATFGTLKSNPCIVITTDKRKDIEERIKIQFEIMKFLLNLDGTKLNFALGKIYIANKNCKIIDQIDLKKMW